MNQNQFKNLIAFCVLMENNEGILEKSPEYVKEKFEMFSNEVFTDGKEVWGRENMGKVGRYLLKWKLGA
jgi:hypothetical protein